MSLPRAEPLRKFERTLNPICKGEPSMRSKATAVSKSMDGGEQARACFITCGRDCSAIHRPYVIVGARGIDFIEFLKSAFRGRGSHADASRYRRFYHSASSVSLCKRGRRSRLRRKRAVIHTAPQGRFMLYVDDPDARTRRTTCKAEPASF